ncbi:hypothetical protein CRM22_010701 [Opisthorchis felineus]|uniref:Uncharacterized protein n=1 Tax=Opisthorchis felineus TaxID=147828 RepID=A0A4S2KQV9_OPIFE|nr:hypothetical protein CRM22_010701 [Opisthorchis felineus]
MKEIVEPPIATGQPDPLADTNVLLGLYGGPYNQSTWDPIVDTLLADENKPPWEFSALIYQVFLYIMLAALLIGQALLLAREARKVIEHLIKRFFLGRKMTEFRVEDWNQIHLSRYTPFQVDYVKGSTEDYRLRLEDYRELLRMLSFIETHGGT